MSKRKLKASIKRRDENPYQIVTAINGSALRTLDTLEKGVNHTITSKPFTMVVGGPNMIAVGGSYYAWQAIISIRR